MLDSAETLVRQLHSLLAPPAALRAALRLLVARRVELSTPPVPLATRAHLETGDEAVKADLERFEAAGRLADLLAELSSIELAPERRDEGAFAALQRSVLDQLCGATPDPALLAEWERCVGVPVASAAVVAAEGGGGAAGSSATAVEVEVQHATRVHFAAERNGVPLVAQVVLTNRGDAALEGLELRLQVGPDFGPPTRIAVPRIEAGGTCVIAAPDVALDRARLSSLTERTSGALHVELRAGPRILARQRRPVELLAWNEWARSLPDEFLPAFVLPNEPVIAELLSELRDLLREATGDPALAGYQASERDRITAIARALGELLVRRQISYAALPASFEKDGQKLRLPAQVVAHRMGNCIELSLLVAALLEQAALHPLLLLVEDHAVAGVWCVATRFETVTIDQLDVVRKLLALGDLLLFDPTVLVGGGTFEAAVAAANALLEQPGRFQRVVDVKAARAAGIVPIAMPVDAARDRAAAGGDSSAAPLGGGQGFGASGPLAASSEPPVALPRPLADRLQQWKQQLLDLTLRNRLISWRDSKRAVVLDGGVLSAIEDRLAEGKTLEFVPRAVLPSGDPRAAELVAVRGADAWVAEERARLFERGALLTSHAPDELDERLLAIFREDRTHIEETGASTLFLALGFLRWHESPTSKIARLAPLLLVPVQLERRGLKRRFVLRMRDEEARANETLLSKLKIELRLDPEALRELPLDAGVGDGVGVDVNAWLAQFRRLVATVPRYEVVDEARLGFFSFAKHQLWHDLEAHRDALLTSELVRHLVDRKSDQRLPDPAFVEPRRLDEVMPATRARLVLDADSSQLAAIEAAVRGATFVLQGPPGTGKSQTIANVIAGCIAAKKRVLFVAEKRAALEVVAARLRKVGLAGACLELHSNRAAKSGVIAELDRTLEETLAARRDDDPLLPERTEQATAALNRHATALHRRGAHGWSHFECVSRRVARREATEVAPLPIAAPLALERRDFERRADAVRELGEAVAASGPLAGHPFTGCSPTEHSPLFARRLDQELGELLAAAVCAAECAAECATRNGGAEAVARLRALAEQFERDRADRGQLAARWDEQLFALDVAALREQFARHADAFAPLRWWKLRSTWKALGPALRGKAPTTAVAMADLALADNVVTRGRAFAAEKPFLDATLGAGASSGTNDPVAVRRFADFLETWRAIGPGLSAIAPPPAVANPAAITPAQAAVAWERAVAAVAASLTTTSEWREHATATAAATAATATAAAGILSVCRDALRWRQQLPALKAWCATVRAVAAAESLDLAPLVAALRRGELAPADLPAAFERAFFTLVVEHAISGDPVLRDFDGARHHELVARFRRDDAALIANGGARVVADWMAQRTVRHDAAFSGSECETLQREAKKKRRQKSLRRLFSEIPTLLAQLKPCLLMSPQSIAQFLPVSQELFDVVVFDEASQIPTHDAIGALARGRKVVIVGDTRQLPPTTFFERALADDEEEDEAQDGGLVRDLESILEEAAAAGVPSLPLRWHYRSRDESLIAFSNRRYYGGRLHTFPAASGRALGLGVSLVDVGGTYEFAGRRVNEAEARAVVDWIVAALSDPARRDKSIGVVTFNQPQQQLIEDLLDQALLQRPELQELADGGARGEPLFVKNIENVQGDERDVMLFSVTFGKGADGRLSLNFGPLNKKGGERRLNVAITRAREKLVVFASLRAEEIDPSRTAAEGVRHLREYLDYARRGAAAFAGAPIVDPEAECESELEADIACELEARGHLVDRQVGCSGYRIDLAVRDAAEPGRHLLGIECDGAAYHSGATARDRDRLRQSVLEGLGWRIHRIWSSDWAERRADEIARVEVAIAAARAAWQREEERGADVATAEPPRIDSEAASTKGPPIVAPPTVALPTYREFPIESTGIRVDPDASVGEHVSELLARIVEFEGPLHVDALLQRAARCCGILRLTAAPEAMLRARLDPLVAAGTVQVRGNFIWPKGLDPALWDVVRLADPAAGPRAADRIPTEERKNALRRVLASAGGGAADDVAAAAARLLGFRAVHQKTREAFRESLAALAADGGCALEGEVVRPKA
ncbi:MAG: DUF3320 domain-containing protein [Planctomycetes bacterium]|nr:DUF3320 domain-containing protein [Planctomycetota bacterium]